MILLQRLPVMNAEAAEKLIPSRPLSFPHGELMRTVSAVVMLLLHMQKLPQAA